MRELDTYSAKDWLTLTPVLHRVKFLRNRALERAYRGRGAAARDEFLAAYAQDLQRKLALTIAFNTPWAVELFLRAARLNLSDTSIIVVDNSSKKQARDEISALCGSYGAAYVGLPQNPEWHPNRSHGIAMNWAYYNLVRPLDPDVFAFLDHDLFALEPFDLAEPVASQPAYGRINLQDGRAAWSLWAGYSIFDDTAVRSRDLDFNYDRPLRLDTGGYNWPRLYRYLDRDTMSFSRDRGVRFQDPRYMSIQPCSMFDCFAHVGGASYGPSGRDADRIDFFRHLMAHIEAGGQWQDFLLSRDDAPDEPVPY